MPDGAKKTLGGLVGGKRLTALPVDGELGKRFEALDSVAGAFDELGWAFYQSLLRELGSDSVVECIMNIAPNLAGLSEEHLAEPLRHPILGRDLNLFPPKDDPRHIPFLAVRYWLLEMLGGQWTFRRDSNTHQRSDAHLPAWPVYSLLETARRFVVQHPDTWDSPERARAFVRIDKPEYDAWFVGRPSFELDQVFVHPAIWFRPPGESRAEFLLRIIRQVSESALRQIVEHAEVVEELGGIAGASEAGQHRADLRQRAEECARRVLGKSSPSEGSSREVQDRLLKELGFLVEPITP